MQSITQKNPCGLTRMQRLRRWFWGTRVGVALNALLGRPTAYRITIAGTMIAKDNLLVVDCYIREMVVSYDQKDFLVTKVSNG